MFLYMRHEQLLSLSYDGGCLYVLIHEIFMSSYRHYLMMVVVYMFLYMRHEQLSSLSYGGGCLCSYT